MRLRLPFPPAMLDRFHARLRARPFLQRFTLVTRTLLAAGFIAPGLTKIAGRAFAPGIDPASPVGAYFVAFHETGAYYAFVGLAQVAAGALLLSRRTALLGACVYAVVIVNIFVLVTATQFGTGTPVVTGLMTLAALWLLGWDAHRLAPLVAPGATLRLRAQEPAAWDALVPWQAAAWTRGLARAGYVIGLAGALAFTLAARGLLPQPVLKGGLLGVVLAALLTGAAWLAHRARTPSAPVPVQT